LKPWQIHLAAMAVARGGVIAYPTEAVYGIGCSPYCLPAVKRVLLLKGRKASKGFILIGSDISQFAALVDLDALKARPAILASWPGPVTWVFPARPGVPEWLTGRHASLAIRVSNHPLVRQLCNKAGILVSTSANPSGCVPARTTQRVRAYFGVRLDYILPGSVGKLAGPTEIRDAVSGNILRAAS